MIIFLLGVFPWTVFSQAITQTRLVDPAPDILVLIRPSTQIRLDDLLDAANREYLNQRVKRLKSLVALNPENTKLPQELAHWKTALDSWKSGTPLSGVSQVVIVENGSELCVAYFPSAEEAFSCYMEKREYKIRERTAKNRLEVTNLTRALYYND